MSIIHCTKFAADHTSAAHFLFGGFELAGGVVGLVVGAEGARDGRSDALMTASHTAP